MNKSAWLFLFLLVLPLDAQIVVSGGGVIAGSNPNQIVGGNISNTYSFNGPFNVVNVTNVYLNPVLSNAVMTGFATNATNAGAVIHSSGGKGTNTVLFGDVQIGGGEGTGSLSVSNTAEFKQDATFRDTVTVTAGGGFDVNTVVYVNPAFQLDTVTGVNNTEVGYLDGVTAPLQQQLNTRSIHTNGVLVSGTVTQLNLVSSSGLRLGASDFSGIVTVTPLLTNAWGVAFTNSTSGNVAHTNDIVLAIPYQINGVTHNTDGFTVTIPGVYFVDARLSYGLNSADGVGMCITTNTVDFPPSYVHSHFPTVTGAGLTYTNFMHTTALIRLVANDRLRLRRWYNVGDGKVFSSYGQAMNIHRLGD